MTTEKDAMALAAVKIAADALNYVGAKREGVQMVIDAHAHLASRIAMLLDLSDANSAIVDEVREAVGLAGKPGNVVTKVVEFVERAARAEAELAAVREDAEDANVRAVRAKLLARSSVGTAKYGVTTERGDLSQADWLRHLQEELMDAAVYIEASMAAIDAARGGE